MKKHLIGFIFCFLITFKVSAASSWIEAYDISWFNDLDNEFCISTPSQLAGVAYLTHQGNTFKDKTIILTSDINLDGLNWIFINDFAGEFNGNFHSISNVNFTTFGSFSKLSGQLQNPVEMLKNYPSVKNFLGA